MPWKPRKSESVDESSDHPSSNVNVLYSYEQALRYFQAAVAVQKDDVGAHINVGRTFFNLKRFLEAEEAYYKAKALLPQAKPGQVSPLNQVS